jgi:hypothetical protein
MVENLAYVIIGFVATYLSLEVAWYFTPYRVIDALRIAAVNMIS